MDYAIGVDMGGTKIETALINDKGKILHKYRCATEANKSKNQIIGNIINAIKEIEKYAQYKKYNIKGIGFSTPGFIAPNKKMSLIANIPAFEGINLITELKKRLRYNIYHENDANCFAYAEHVFGAAKNKKNSIGIIWGTGVGSGIIINDKLHVGYKGSAGEIGHNVLNPDAPLRCSNCKQKGDVESYCSAPNLIKYYKHYKGKKKDVDSTYIMSSSDLIAKKVREQCLHYLSLCVSILVNTLNPEIIVLGGGISNSNHYEKINKMVNGFVAPAMRNTFKIVKHKISDSSGIIGAAALVFKGDQ